AAPTGRSDGTARVRVVMLLTFLAAFLLGTLIVLFVEKNRLQGKQKQVGDITAHLASTIQDRLNRSLSVTYALTALIRQGNGHIDHFDQLGTEMLSLYDGINSLQLVPEGIIRQVVPLRGNEKAIGLNLLTDTARSNEALVAVKTRRLTLAGPFELIQGGQAVVGRLPVFLHRPDGSEYFWGLVSVVIRIPDFLNAARLQQIVADGYQYELSRIRPDTGTREVFARSADAPLRSPVQYTIDVPNGSWVLGLEPRDGWRFTPTIIGECALVLLISTLVASMLGTLYKQPLVLRRMVDERTSQLSESNQRLTSEMRERERAEEALRASEAFYRTLVDNLPLGISQVDRNHHIVMTNRTLSSWLGRPQESFVGKPCHEQFEQREHICPHCPGTVSMQSGGVAQVDTEGIREDGSRFAVRLRSVPLFDGNGVATGFIEVAEDITERQRAEDELRQSEARLRESQRVAHIGHYELDVITGHWTSSEELDAIFGIDEPYARDIQGWREIVHPEQRDEIADYFARHVVGEGRSFNKEYRIERASDKATRWVHGLGRLEFAADGRVLKMFGTIQDITNRKLIEADRHKLEAQVLHAQKLESLGVLAGGIAHDFNNILMTILGHAELAMMRLNPASPARDNLLSIEQAAQRAADLSRQMLAYSGKGKFVVEVVELGDLVTEMTHMLEVSISKKALLRFNLATNLPPVEVDATQIRQVLMNLVINASEAIGD
ncbi:MAG TPA: PAS domain S-box protein, partial [Desulfuromonadaceae bacterium]